ncbi:MAG: ribose 5-phosphate isomerase B [Planctomycetota bacterium]|nr:ribose 5-phosphate isomerase B [Planctomycetota bacterium]
MKIALGTDHRGYHVKERLKNFLLELGHVVADCGCPSDKSCDYPDYSIPPCLKVTRGQADRAVLLCGSGIGMTMTANKVAGIRAALCHDELTAEMSRRHNDANVLCLPADLLGDELIRRMIQVWLNTPFDGGRHARRVKKIMAAERHLCDAQPDEAATAEARRRRKARSKKRTSN